MVISTGVWCGGCRFVTDVGGWDVGLLWQQQSQLVRLWGKTMKVCFSGQSSNLDKRKNWRKNKKTGHTVFIHSLIWSQRQMCVVSFVLCLPATQSNPCLFTCTFLFDVVVSKGRFARLHTTRRLISSVHSSGSPIHILQRHLAIWKERFYSRWEIASIVIEIHSWHCRK